MTLSCQDILVILGKTYNILTRSYKYFFVGFYPFSVIMENHWPYLFSPSFWSYSLLSGIGFKVLYSDQIMLVAVSQ